MSKVSGATYLTNIGNLAGEPPGRTIKLRKIGQTNPRTIFVRTASGMVDLTDIGELAREPPL